MSTLRVDTIQNASGTDSPINVPGTAKAWVNFNGTGTVAIRASYNVSSITDNGTGDYTVNFTTAMPDANYSTVSSAGRTTPGASIASPSYSAAPTANGVQIAVYNTSGTLIDVDRVTVAIFR